MAGSSQEKNDRWDSLWRYLQTWRLELHVVSHIGQIRFRHLVKQENWGLEKQDNKTIEEKKAVERAHQSNYRPSWSERR